MNNLSAKSGVFVSYVDEDEPIVDSLCSALARRGIAAWRAKAAIGAGDNWKREIRLAIQNGNSFLACFSNQLGRRRRSYMYDELMIAVDELRRRPPDRAWFIPVRLEPCEIPEIPIGGGDTLTALHFVDLFDDWTRGVDAIARTIHAASRENRDTDMGSRIAAKLIAAGLSSSDPIDREIAIRNLQEVMPLSDDAKSALEVQLLREDNPRVLERVADALATLGEEVVGDLCEMLDRHVKDPVRYSTGIRAVVVLERMGKIAEQAIPQLAAVLRLNPYEQDPEAAVELLGRLGEAAVPTLLELAVETHIRMRAFRALAQAGDAAAPAVPILVAALEDWDPMTKSVAAGALGKIRTNPELSVPALARATYASSDGDPSWPGSSAAWALGEYGEAAAPAIPTLISHVSHAAAYDDDYADNDDHLGEAAAETLGKIGKPALQPLLELLPTANELTAKRCAIALGIIGPEAYQAIPQLCRLADQSSDPHEKLIAAIGRIGVWSDMVQTTLLRCLKLLDEHPFARAFEEALSVATKFGSRAAPLLSAALPHIGEWNGERDKRVIALTISIGEPAIPELTKIIEPRLDGSWNFRRGHDLWNSIICLAAIATAHPAARPLVAQLSRDDDWEIRYSVAKGLDRGASNGRLDDWSRAILNRLAADSDRSTRITALQALSE
jgi:HEAT repeat protein